MSHEDTSLRKRTAVEVFRLGRELATLQDQLKAEGRWVTWLVEKSISRTSAWEAVELFRRARTEEAVRSLDVTTAKKQFGIVKDRPERKSTPASPSPVEEPSPPVEPVQESSPALESVQEPCPAHEAVAPASTHTAPEQSVEVADAEALEREWVFTMRADLLRPDLPHPVEMMEILVHIYDERRVGQIAAGLRKHLERKSRRRSRLVEKVIERVGAHWDEYDRDCCQRARNVVELELIEAIGDGATEDEAVGLVADVILRLYEPHPRMRGAHPAVELPLDDEEMDISSEFVDDESVIEPEEFVLDERELGRAGIDLGES